MKKIGYPRKVGQLNYQGNTFPSPIFIAFGNKNSTLERVEYLKFVQLYVGSQKIKQTQLILLVIFVAFLLLSCGNNSKEVVDNTPKEPTKEDKIQFIKDEFSKIESNLYNYKFKEAIYDGVKEEDGFQYHVYIEWDAYYNDGKIVKLTEESGEEGYWTKINYYYDKDENLFFIFEQSEFDGELESEARIYISDGVIIDALQRAKDYIKEISFKDAKNKKYDAVLTGALNDMYLLWEKSSKEDFLKNVDK